MRLAKGVHSEQALLLPEVVLLMFGNHGNVVIQWGTPLSFSKPHLTYFVNINGVFHPLDRCLFNESNMTCKKRQRCVCRAHH